LILRLKDEGLRAKGRDVKIACTKRIEVEAIGFPHLAIKYDVRGVPRTVINETIQIEGAAPEAMLMAKLQEVL